MSSHTLTPKLQQTHQPPSVSAVVVNFNGGDCIINCLQALYRQTIPVETIIVVDNGSTDGSPDNIRAHFPTVKILELGQNKGLPAARNAALQLVSTDLVLMVDDDTYVTEDCLHHMLKIYGREKPTVICPRVILTPECDIVQCDGAEPHFIGTMALRHGYTPLKEILAEETKSVGGCIGTCFLLDRTKVLAAGAFNEAYFIYFEDLEFSFRLRALGYRIVCEPAAIVYHDRGQGTPNLSFRGRGPYPARRAYLTMYCRLMTIFIYYRARTLTVLLPVLALYEFATFVVVLLQGWGKEWTRVYLSLLRNASSIWQRRQLMQQTRRVNDRDLLVGGPLPLAPGFVRSPIAGLAVTMLSTTLNAYWRITQRWIG